ncbi:post-GPI attachment to proteins factor 2-like [Watersipora subatra]|uniref:post-GPI attachment to proteins factor 2-like n=1 Tax=Watersipora subatra TaxID=2589382 RepID=UPI00355C2F1B
MTFYNTVSTIRWRQDNSIYIIACVILKMVEVTALFLLTLVSSTANFGFHKFSFLTFIIASLLYMAGTILLQASLVKDTKNRMLRKSLRYKKIFCTASMLAIFTAGYMYWRHNTYCEPGVYSLFGLSEYLFVIFNIAFHATCMLDFSSLQPLPQSQATEKVDHMLV